MPWKKNPKPMRAPISDGSSASKVKVGASNEMSTNYTSISGRFASELATESATGMDFMLVICKEQ